MELEEIILSINNLGFDDVVKQESKEYLLNAEKLIAYQDRDDDKKYITNGLKRFINKNDKIVFLLEAINFFNEEKAEAESNLDIKIVESFSWEREYSRHDRENYDYHSRLFNYSKRCTTRIFYAVRELEKLGLAGLYKNAFSNAQVTDLTRKINALLIKIDELTVGQEVIFNHIDELKADFNELKGDFPLGKKRWYQRLSGIVASYLGNKGADILYDALKPDLLNIINESGMNKLLR